MSETIHEETNSNQSEPSETETGDLDWITLGPFRKAAKVNDSVLIREQRGNLVQKIFIDKDEWEQIGALFGTENTNEVENNNDE